MEKLILLTYIFSNHVIVEIKYYFSIIFYLIDITKYFVNVFSLFLITIFYQIFYNLLNLEKWLFYSGQMHILYLLIVILYK